MADRPRKWPIAGLATLFALGLGQVYNGQWRKALVFHGAGLLTFALIALLINSSYFHLATPIAVLAAIAIWGWAIFDAITVSRRRASAYEPKWFNRGTVYVGIALSAWLWVEA